MLHEFNRAVQRGQRLRGLRTRLRSAASPTSARVTGVAVVGSQMQKARTATPTPSSFRVGTQSMRLSCLGARAAV
jgi:hypothetical protein